MLADTCAEAARRFGDRAAVVAEAGWSLGYAELDRASDEVAAGLAARGLEAGDVVGLVLPAVPEHFVAYLAVAKLGAVTAAVNPRLAPPERAAVLAVVDPALVLATDELAPAGAVVVEEAGGPDEVLAGVRLGGAGPSRLSPDPHRPVAVVFTSGTTGLPKGVVFNQSQIDFITSVDVGEGWGGGGPSLTGSALAHLGPMTKLDGNLRRGTTQYLSKAWRAAETLRRISELRIAGIGGIPTQLALMLAEPDFDSYDLRCVRAIVVGGGPATPSLVREARARFGVPLSTRYSCTEAGIGTATAFDAADEDAEVSVGRPQPGVVVEIVDGDGHPVEAGRIGEVCLGSPAVMAGYWRDPEGTAQALLRPGVVRTGDLGYLDDQGRLHLAGRSKERYVRGGYNVYPMEVEAVLADHPAVAAVAVVPREDRVMGEIGVAVVVPGAGGRVPPLDELRDFAGRRLARYKLPDDLVAVEALPLTAMEKVDRRALALLVEEGPVVR